MTELRLNLLTWLQRKTYLKDEITSLLNNKANTSDLATVATTGSYNNLSNKPTIPSANTTASNIKMNGTQSAGSLSTFAKADHIHPSDTTKADASGLEFQQISLPNNLGATLYANDYICILEVNHSPGAADKEITTSWSDIDTTTNVIPKVPDQYAPIMPVMSMSSGTMNILVKIGETNDGKGVVQVRMLSGTGTLTTSNYIKCTLVWRRPTASELT